MLRTMRIPSSVMRGALVAVEDLALAAATGALAGLAIAELGELLAERVLGAAHLKHGLVLFEHMALQPGQAFLDALVTDVVHGRSLRRPGAGWQGKSQATQSCSATRMCSENTSGMAGLRITSSTPASTACRSRTGLFTVLETRMK